MCGIIGVAGDDGDAMQEGTAWAAREVYRGLLTLQHRGQDAAGILSYDFNESRFYQKKDMGLVSQVFQKHSLNSLQGSMAIGHTRYATVGMAEDLQPLITGFPFGVAMVHNGNLLNYHSVAAQMKKYFKSQLLTGNDLELILRLWCYYLLEQSKMSNLEFSFDKAFTAMEKVVKKVEGAYALTGIVANAGLIAFRDPQGIRPLVLGKKKLKNDRFIYCVCSETVAMNFLGFSYERSIKPGEFLFIDQQGKIYSRIMERKRKKATCMFEWVYFSGAESKVEERFVYTTRLKLGERLALKAKQALEKGEINPHVVAPVPDTSRTASIALAEKLNLPYREVFIKNRYCQRSFILADQSKREKTVELKLSPVCSEIKGKNIMLVDDSIVRGTTARKIVELLKDYGANEVSLAITCPPIRYPCYYGIDFPTANELIASGRSEREVSKWVKAKKIIYLDSVDLREAIGKDELCMACINNQYPTSVKEGGYFAHYRRKNEEIRAQ